jgi:hypothetical protein
MHVRVRQSTAARFDGLAIGTGLGDLQEGTLCRQVRWPGGNGGGQERSCLSAWCAVFV